MQPLQLPKRYTRVTGWERVSSRNVRNPLSHRTGTSRCLSTRAIRARHALSTPAVRPRYACDTLAVRAPYARDTRSMHPQYDRGTRASIVTRQSFPASQHSAGSEKPRVDSHKSLDDCGNMPLATASRLAPSDRT